MIKRSAFLVGLFSVFTSQARAERLVSAYDPKVHIRPPTMKALDGHGAELVIDEEFLESAARYQAAHPRLAVAADSADVRRVGEVLVVHGNTTDILTTNGTAFGLQRNGLQALTKKVIE